MARRQVWRLPRRPPFPQPMRRYLRDEFEYLAHAESAAVSRLLKSEAAYMRSALGPLNGLQMALYDEMRSRLPDEQITPSERFGDWLYYSRTTARQDLPQFCRRHVDGGAEQVVFDLAALADKHGYAALGAFKVSPDQSLLACTVDLSGREKWELRVIELVSGRVVSAVAGVLNAEWARGEELVYTQIDERGRPWRARLHTVGQRGTHDPVVYEEADGAALIDVAATKGGTWLTINSNSHTSSEVRLVRVAAPSEPALLVAPREPGVSYFVEELARPDWLLLIASLAPPSRALGLSAVRVASLPAPRTAWLPLLAPSEHTAIEDVDVHERWVALYERHRGVKRVRVLRTRPADEPATAPPTLSDEQIVPLPNGSLPNGSLPNGLAPCAVTAGANRQFATDAIHFTLSSPTMPPTPYAYDMVTRALTARSAPIEPPPSPELCCELTHATARDGASIPLTLVRAVSLVPDAQTPLHCMVYGAYGAVLEAEWRAEHLPLLRRGWIIALAHVRGGGELGPPWHHAGSRLAKATSAADLADCLRWLHTHGISSPPRTSAVADSAGALALGGVLNAEGTALLGAALLRMPFLDPLSAMLDPSLPLTLEEAEEWGDPIRCEATRQAMAAYSPYDGLRWRASRLPDEKGGGDDDDDERQRLHYPAVLCITAKHDTRVCFTQALRWVTRLRHRAAGANRREQREAADEDSDTDTSTRPPPPPQLLYVRDVGGHLGEGGRFRRLEQASMELAFLMHALGESETDV